MGAFATQFEVALREMNFRQIEVVRRAGRGVSATQVSRYVSGDALPELPALEALAQIFPEQIRERLITAYLLDHIPPSAAHLVTVQPIDGQSAATSPVYGKAVKGSDLAQALMYLEERALLSRPIADMIIATAEALKPDPLNLVFDMDDRQEGPGDSARVREDATADAEA